MTTASSRNACVHSKQLIYLKHWICSWFAALECDEAACLRKKQHHFGFQSCLLHLASMAEFVKYFEVCFIRRSRGILFNFRERVCLMEFSSTHILNTKRLRLQNVFLHATEKRAAGLKSAADCLPEYSFKLRPHRATINLVTVSKYSNLSRHCKQFIHGNRWKIYCP